MLAPPVVAGAILVGAFLLGSIPTGVIVARARGIDLRKIGSGNIGATNVGRALGKGWAAFVLVVDAGKGFLPVLAAPRLGASALVTALAGLAAICGHSFSIFLKGRGGKGVATSLGAAVALAPLPALGSFAVWLVIYAAFRLSSLGSLCGVCAYPLFLWLLGVREPAAYVFAVATAALVVVRHHENIRRLVRGRELKS